MNYFGENNIQLEVIASVNKMFVRFRIIVEFILLSLTMANGARILAVFSNPSYSHHQVFNCLVDAYLEQGHQVVVITAYPVYPKGQVPRNLTQIDIKEISLKIWDEEISKPIANKENNIVTLCTYSLTSFVKIVKKQFEIEEVKAIIENKNITYDLIVTESLMKTNLMISHFHKAPVLEINSFGPVYRDMENFGAPEQPLLYPNCMRKRLINLTLFEEISELHVDLSLQRLIYNVLYLGSNNAMKNTPEFNSVPAMEILQNNAQMLYLNTHPIWDGIRPVPLSVVYIYGIHKKPYEELPKNISSYLEASVNGVVYVSFGTTADLSLYSAKIQVLLNAFSKLPYDILFKWPKDELPGKPDNVKIAKWFPQADLLKHPKVKVFITQGGIQSTDEAIDAGVPLIGIPLIWDQWASTERYMRHGIGIKLEMNTITEELIINAVTTIISDSSYRRNIVRLRALLWDAPQQPLERALWWTRYMLRHGGASHLRAPAANMSYAEFFEVELFLILFASSTTLILCTIFICMKYLIPTFNFGLDWLKCKYIHVKYNI
ncbi:UDP-glycosyltransferase UGT5-like [Galleria mellonella]|uniref:UDP-glycosyltransferase UGT5-like n=1 Tax=Galleria mellonella TaxID=7137 RepID=A0A6J3C280_GALME|nr:UDP-glycosyltransferase UGT5-like [Galleria mellonella]